MQFPIFNPRPRRPYQASIARGFSMSSRLVRGREPGDKAAPVKKSGHVLDQSRSTVCDSFDSILRRPISDRGGPSRLGRRRTRTSQGSDPHAWTGSRVCAPPAIGDQLRSRVRPLSARKYYPSEPSSPLSTPSVRSSGRPSRSPWFNTTSVAAWHRDSPTDRRIWTMSGKVSPERSPPAASPTDAIAAADPEAAVDTDEFDTEELVSNASTSIKSSILEHSVENGRRVRSPPLATAFLLELH